MKYFDKFFTTITITAVIGGVTLTVATDNLVHAAAVRTAVGVSSSTWGHSGSGLGVGIGSGHGGRYGLGYGYPFMYDDNLPPAALAQAKAESAASEVFYAHGTLAMMKAKTGWGLLGTEGQEVLAPTFKSIIQIGDKGLLRAIGKEKGSSTLLLPNGEKADSAVLAAEFAQDKEQLMPFRDPETKRYGFKKMDGTIALPAVYKEIMTEFSEDRAFVKNADGKKVAIDTTGKEIFENPYNDVGPYEDGLAEYQRTVNNFSIGTVVGIAFNSGGHGRHRYDNGTYTGIDLVQHDGVKRGYLNRSGDIVIDSKLDRVYPMTSLGAIVENNGKLAFLNREGKEVIPYGDYSALNMDINFAYLGLKNKDTDKSGVVSMLDGKTILPFSYDGVTVLTQGMVAAKNGDIIQIISGAENNRVLFTLSKGAKFQGFGSDQYMWVTKDTLLSDFAGYKIIDMEGKVLYTDTKNEIKEVSIFAHGYSNVKINGKWGIMDSQGNLLVKPVYEKIISL